MRIESQQPTYKKCPSNPKFGGLTDLMMDNVFLNKTLFDLTGSDIPWVVMANNKEERRERINRASLSIGLIFLPPLLVIPFVNKFAMSKIVKLTSEYSSKNYNAIRLSNKYLSSAEKTKEGLTELAKQKTFSNELRDMYYKYIKRKPVPEDKLDVPELMKHVDGDYDKLRKKISTAKSIVMAVDLAIIAGVFGHIGFYNNWQTEKKTGQIGYSAEMKMADKEVIEGRAAKYKRNEKIRYGAFLATLASVCVGGPMLVRHGVLTNKTGKISDFIKKHCEKLDYKDTIFMKRFALFTSFLTANIGIFMASRNKTERKDNIIRSINTLILFFCGDLLLASGLGRLSDRILKTKMMKPGDKSLFNKILPSMKDLQELKATKHPETIRNAKTIFWANFIFLSLMNGVITPHIINKVIKKDVDADVQKAQKH